MYSFMYVWRFCLSLCLSVYMYNLHVYISYTHIGTCSTFSNENFSDNSTETWHYIYMSTFYIHMIAHTIYTYTWLYTLQYIVTPFRYIHTYIRTYIHTFIHTYIHKHTHIHIFIYTHTYIHINTYIHTYIHTHDCTQHSTSQYLFRSLSCRRCISIVCKHRWTTV